MSNAADSRSRSPRLTLSAHDRTRMPSCSSLGAFLALVLGVLALAPSAALASSAHAFSHSFGAPGAGAGQLSLAPVVYGIAGSGQPIARSGGSGLAVDDESGDVYVADTENHRVVEFTAAGSFVRTFGLNVNKTAAETSGRESEANVCPAPGHPSDVCQKGTSGTAPGAFQKPTFLAVDNASGGEGDLYVGDVGDETITKLDAEGNPIASWGTAGQLSQAATTATGTGDIANGSATGSGDVGQGSTTITNVATESGAFEAGQGIAGPNIQEATYITAVGAGTLTISRPSGGSPTSGAHLSARPDFVTGLSTSAGAFLRGQEIAGPGIPAGTEITEAGPGVLQLSRDATAGGAGVSLSASTAFPLLLTGLAVDASGRLWALARNTSLEHSVENAVAFARSGAFQGGLTLHREGYLYGGFGAEPLGLSRDAAGSLYVVSGSDIVDKFDSSGERLGSLTEWPGMPAPPVTSLAADPAPGDLYVDLGSALEHLAPSCAPVVNNGITCPPSETFGNAQLSEHSQGSGLAVDPTDHTVYAADAGSEQVHAYADVLEAETEAAGEVEATTATLNGTVNPKGSAITACRFEYGATTSYGHTTPCSPDAGGIGSGSSPVPVHAALSRLRPETTYHFRLTVASATVPALKAEDVTLETKPEALIEAAAASEVTETSALLTATVNPKGVAVESCAFEYDTSPYRPEEAPHGTAVPCEPSPGSGTSGIQVSHAIEGLSPNTEYHFRLAVADANGTATSPDHSFVYLTGPIGLQHGCGNEALRGENASLLLPDCRAYEQVTPTHKNGALIGAAFVALWPQLAANGERVIAPSIQCFHESPSCIAARQIEGAPFAFARTAAGWQTTPLALPAASFAGATNWLDSAETGAALYGAPTQPGGEDDFYARAFGGALTHIGPTTPPALGALGPGGVNGGYGLLGTADFSHVVYQTGPNDNWPFDPTISPLNGLYEYAAPASQPLMVGVGGGYEGGENHHLISRCGTLPGAGIQSPSLGEALSTDGRTVYFTAEKCLASENGGVKVPADTVYARVGGETEEAHTVDISNPTPSECGTGAEPDEEACRKAPAAAAYLEGASTDGQLAYFASTRQLTDVASEDPSASDTAKNQGCSSATGQNGCNLYLYDLGAEGRHLTDVSAGDVSGEGPRFQGMVAVSADGSSAYFVAKGVLASNPGAAIDVESGEAEHAEAGADNLYLYRRDAAHPEGSVAFIAALPAADSGNWSGGGELISANVSPDGNYLVFESHAGLTPDATRAAGPAQVYRYDAGSGMLLRLSIGVRGFNDDGNATKAGAQIVPALRAVNGAPAGARRDPTMSDDGRFVFFESPAALTPGALDEREIATSNGHPVYAQNVYEWEADNAGGCEEARGCVQLISDGRDLTETNTISSVALLGSDASGENVFFATADRLTPSDTDSQRDYYDARRYGGFPKAAEPSICETADGCHPGGSEEGAASQPASNGFAGPEEGPGHPQKPKGCPKGKVRRHGHCVKKPHHKRHGRHKHRRQANHGGRR